MSKLTRLVLFLPLLLAACDFRAGVTTAGTATPFVITATLEPTAIPSATLTPMPPTPSPTTVPVQGMTSTQVNVRGEPSTGAPSLSILPPFVNVQIVGSDAQVTWYEILDPQGPNGMGWVSAQFITVPQNKDKIPVVVGAATETATLGSGTPSAGGTPGASAGGTVIQQLNVRKGPGTSFDAIGTLNPNDTVTLVAKDPSGQWYQITFASGPDGKGWVAASFIEATGTENLPVVGSAGATIGTGTPGAVALVATAAPKPAFDDQDSAGSPAASVALSPVEASTLIYTSDLSAPQGDPQDWIRFTPSSARILVRLRCTGNSGIAVQVTADGAILADPAGDACGQEMDVTVAPGKPYLVQLSIVNPGTSLSYARYTLEVKAQP